ETLPLNPGESAKFYTDGWWAYERHLAAEQHQVGEENTQKIESKHIRIFGLWGSFHKPTTDFLQFLQTLCRRLRIGHIEPCERVKDDLRDDEPSVLLVVGGHDVPRSFLGARGTEAFLVGADIVLPEFPLLDIRHAEFPILFRIVYPCEKTPALFLLRQMEKEF